MALKGQAYQTDWLISPTSNVHIATHREWFTTFIEFKGNMDSMYAGPEAGGGYLGVGDVELTVIKALDQGRLISKKIILRDVLYQPNFVANIFGELADTGYLMDPIITRKVMSRETRRTICKIDQKAMLPRLWLKKQKPGKSSLDPAGLYAITAWWSDEDRARWDSFKEMKASRTEPCYTDEEKAYLKRNYRGEYRFLRLHRLSIYKEEDRNEGRRILRSIISQEADNQSQYTEDEKAYLNKHYRGEYRFLRLHGLSIYKDEDRDEGRSILRALMEENEEAADAEKPLAAGPQPDSSSRPVNGMPFRYMCMSAWKIVI